ncbi:AraC family transcriptional regulator [Aurantivibrio plasticivorans]
MNYQFRQLHNNNMPTARTLDLNIDNCRVSAQEVLSLLSASIDAGMDLQTLLLELKLPGDYIDDQSSTISINDCWRIFNAQYNLDSEESHHLSQRPLTRGTTRLVFNNLVHCGSLQEALNTIANTYNVVHGGEFNFVKKHGQTLRYVVDDRNFHYAGTPQIFAIEFALLRIHCAVSILANKVLRLKNVSTIRRELPSYHNHLALFGCKLSTGESVYELVYDIEDADQSLSNSLNVDINGNLFGPYLHFLNDKNQRPLDGDFALQARHVLDERFALHQQCDQSSVATALHVSVATLRRRLQAEGLSFRALIDEAKAEQAASALYEFKSSETAAQMLGYCDSRSFKRAFRRWHGVSPAEYMRSHHIR